MRKLVLTGLAISLLLAIPLTAMFYLGSRLLNLPLPPLDLFDGAARVLPGQLITAGIDGIIMVIRALQLGATDQTAKLIEQAMGYAMFGGLVTLTGTALFAWFVQARPRQPYIIGAVTGVVLGALMMGVHLALPQAGQSNPLTAGVWTFGLFIAWGLALAWSYLDLVKPVADEPKAEFAPLNRREFLLKLGGATATISLAGVGLGTIFGASDASDTAITPVSSDGVAGGTGRWSESNALPNANAAVAPAPGTRVELTSLEDHYRIDINTRSQRVDPETWRLPITGLVDNPIEFTLDQLQTDFEPVHQFLTLSCISNSVGGDLISTQRWTGARFSEVLARVSPQVNAAYVRITAVDGFYEYVAVDDIMNDDRIILCYHWDGVPLPGEHGFPLRVYLPDRYGMKQPKWITGMELVENWEEGYWVARTWDEVARVQTTSVIDTIGVNDTFERDGVTYVPLGGIAYAGARGIQRVEVQINGGDWQEAQLRDPMSDITWVVWRYDLPFAEGEHTIAVRAVDGNGELQTDRVAPSHPSGATGIHTRSRRL